MNDKISKFIIDNKAKIMKNIFSSFLIVVCTSLLGAWNWVSFGFSVEVLKTSEYWIHVGIRSICLICMYQVGVNLFFDRIREKSTVLQSEVETYEQLNKLRDVNFNEYVDGHLNRDIKKEAYRKRMLKKIYKLDKKATDTEKLLFLENDPEAEMLIRRKMVKKKDNKYCIKKQAILDLLKEENLDRTIDMLDVKYQHVEAAAFDLDIHGNISVDSYKVRSKQGTATAQAITKALAFMLPMGMVASSLVPGLIEGNTITSVINCIMDIGFCLWQLIRGIMFCETLLNAEYILPYSNRNRILKMYINWNKGNEKSASKKILDYIETSKNNS